MSLGFLFSLPAIAILVVLVGLCTEKSIFLIPVLIGHSCYMVWCGDEQKGLFIVFKYLDNWEQSLLRRRFEEESKG